MTTKTCNKCGWVLAIQDPNVYCPICHTRFTVGICQVCKQPVEYYRDDRKVCRKCYDTVIRKPDAKARLKARREGVYNELLEKIAHIPKSYPTLSEAQWMQAVKHFNGCALCKSESVDTRGYFIPFNKGGRYCDWNIIPMCEKCAIKPKTNPNYFLNRRPEGLIDIIKYLEEKIDEASRKGAAAGK